MKTISLIIFMLVAWLHSPGQKFTYEVTRANGFVSDAIKGKVEIGDSIISMTHVPGIETKFKVVAVTNGTTYLTDGVMTHRMIALNDPGKLKGHPYDYVVTLFLDTRQGGGMMIYYCRKQN